MYTGKYQFISWKIPKNLRFVPGAVNGDLALLARHWLTSVDINCTWALTTLALHSSFFVAISERRVLRQKLKRSATGIPTKKIFQ